MITVEPLSVSREGGDTLTISGTFSTSQTYTATLAGVAVYGGVSGKGALLEYVSDTTLRCVVPRSATIGTQVLSVLAMPSAAVQTANVSVVEKTFGRAQFEVRRMMHPFSELGARRLDAEPAE